MLIASAKCTLDVRVAALASGSASSQAPVDLDHVHVRDALRQVLREHAQAAADLQHDVLRGELGGPADHAEDVRVDQEVLAELAVGMYAELAACGAGWAGRVARSVRDGLIPAEHARRVALHRRAELIHGDPAQRGDERAAVWATNAGWLRCLAHGLGRQIRRVGLDEQALLRGGGAPAGEVRRASVGDVAGERDRVAALQALLQPARASRSSGSRR